MSSSNLKSAYGGIIATGRSSGKTNLSTKVKMERFAEQYGAGRDVANAAGPPGFEWVVEGAKVTLRANSGYTPARNNPKSGSQYVCSGSILSIDHDRPRPVEVRWANSTQNHYFFEDLDPVDKKSLYQDFIETLEEPKKKKQKVDPKKIIFEIGDDVFMKPGYFKSGAPDHPVLGSRFQVPGTVEELDYGKNEVIVRILWYNGARLRIHVKYKAKENPELNPLLLSKDKESLKAFVKDHPNFGFKLLKKTSHNDHGVTEIFREVMELNEPAEDYEPFSKGYEKYIDKVKANGTWTTAGRWDSQGKGR